ncbi:MAG TPA: MogA/MoaB family molybdenum cofactor biosynthesis protein [Thermoanaerobaculia bacterium]|nr:MogA/MoaB family molybdenum cofactor biosynthesis protein [Thermoanaerobaculia bacterium]
MIVARVITCSDSASRGERVDLSGPALRGLLEDLGWSVDRVEIVPDERDRIAAAIAAAIDGDGVRLVVTTGGTGLSPRDVTPEATVEVAERLVPGFGELMRLRSLEKTPMAPLSRAEAAVRGRALIVNLPGSPKAAVENFEAVAHLVPHALELLAGEPIEEHPGSA